MTLSPDQIFISNSLGVVSSAQDDVDLLYEEQGADAPFSEWLETQRTAKPHWFKLEADSSLEVLYSLKAQADYIKANGQGPLEAILKANNLAVGKIKPRPKEDVSKLSPSTNPYHPNFKGDRAAKIASMIRAMGTNAVSQIAASAGRAIDGGPLRK